MTNSKHISFLDLQEDIKSQFHGGFEGLEILFNKHINKLKLLNYDLSHSNFVDFYKGKNIDVLGIDDKIYLKNTDKLESLCFNTFFEKNFQFYYESTPFDAFNNPKNLLQETLNKIKKVVLNEQFETNQKTLFLNEVLMYINTQISISDSVKKNENNILYDKLVYISNGYKAIVELIQMLYGKSFSLIDSLSTSVIKSKENKTADWHLVFCEILKGNILVQKLANNNKKYFYLSEEFDSGSKLGDHLAKVLKRKDSTIRPIVTSSINGNAQKDIFVKTNLIKINDLIDLYGNNMCDFFKEKYTDLI